MKIVVYVLKERAPMFIEFAMSLSVCGAGRADTVARTPVSVMTPCGQETCRAISLEAFLRWRLLPEATNFNNQGIRIGKYLKTKQLKSTRINQFQ